jgi:hypothetical protein
MMDWLSEAWRQIGLFFQMRAVNSTIRCINQITDNDKNEGAGRIIDCFVEYLYISPSKKAGNISL